MSNYHSTPFENGFAVLTDRLSQVCVNHPATVGRFVMGEHVTRWHRTATDAVAVDGWLYVPGVKTSGRRPATYTHAVVLEMDQGLQAQFSPDANGDDCSFAAAYTIGGNVMAATIDLSGTAEDELIAEAAPMDSGLLRVVLRVGKGSMEATLGTYDANTNMFSDAGGPAVSISMNPAPIAEVLDRFPDAHWL